MLMNVKLENLCVMLMLSARIQWEAISVSAPVDTLGMEEIAVS